MSAILAEEFVKSGHEVRVVTQTPKESPDEYSYGVIRKPNWRELIKAVRWSDIVLHNNISLQTAWPLSFIRRPWVVVHQTWIRKVDGSIGRQEKLKRWSLRFAHQVAISEAIARDIEGCSTIIGNCYNSDLFRILPEVERTRDLVFVGRLVSDKGADLAIRAVGELKDRGTEANLTIVGKGEDESKLKALASEVAPGQVHFTGALSGEALVAEINKHKVMVVPSIWKEPFGIVALEGIACGCVVVGSDGGGLKDAIGPCGLTFPNGDLNQLVESLAAVLTDTSTYATFSLDAPDHLAKHTSLVIARKYLDILEGATR